MSTCTCTLYSTCKWSLISLTWLSIKPKTIMVKCRPADDMSVPLSFMDKNAVYILNFLKFYKTHKISPFEKNLSGRSRFVKQNRELSWNVQHLRKTRDPQNRRVILPKCGLFPSEVLNLLPCRIYVLQLKKKNKFFKGSLNLNQLHMQPLQ